MYVNIEKSIANKKCCLTWSSQENGSLLVEDRGEVANTAESVGEVEAGKGEQSGQYEQVGQHDDTE